MLIKNLFQKPIDRDIKGVIKVGQGDDENVRQELEEYVVTKELARHFRDFFANYKKGIDGNTDKMGVWISGFFGSGKSHFLKILSYLLENRVVNGKTAIEYFIDDNKIVDSIVLGDMKLAANTPTDVILFNIDSKSSMADSQNNKEAILSVFLKVFNQHLGFYGANPHLADLERTLTEEGKFDEFKKAFYEIRNKEWNESRHQFRFIQDQVCETLVKINYASMDSAKNICESFVQPYNIDTTDFAKMVQKHIKTKGKNHHVCFLVDEVGQYIGDKSDLMLNLQSVTEELGTYCGGKAWIVVTSQQDVDSITSVKGNDFSKIQGRFDTRLSLSSADVAEVIKKRILEKTETATDGLGLLFDEKEIIIKNLIVFNDGVEKKLYKDKGDFISVYPFIPYQFNLLGDVLTSIRTHGTSGKHLAEGERSMLSLYRESAIAIMKNESGSLIPFCSFYNALEQFLDHSHRVVISRARDNETLNPGGDDKCYDVEVLKSLFMIKYLDGAIISNLENITTLMASHIDEDRIALKDKTEAALRRLCSQNYVQQTGEIFIFLSNEEQEINRAIDEQAAEISEITAKISEKIFESLYDEKKYRYPAFNGRYNFSFNQMVDDKLYRNNQNFDITLRILTPNYDGASEETTLRLMSGQGATVVVALPKDPAFINEIRQAIKIEKYLMKNSSSPIPKFEQIKEAKRSEVRERIANATLFLESSMREAEIYANGDKLQIGFKDIKSRINDALGKVVDMVFHKLRYIDTAMGETQIISLLRGKENAQLTIDQSANVIPNKLALDDVFDFISMNTTRHAKTSMKSIKDRFMKAPYGFIEDDIEWLVANLFKNGNISFFVNQEPITILTKTHDEIYRYINRREFSERLLTEKREKPDDKQKKIVREVMLELFKTAINDDDEDAVLQNFIRHATIMKNELEKLEIHYRTTPEYPGKNTITKGRELMLHSIALQDTTSFFKGIAKQQDEFLDFAEDFEPIKLFFEGEQKKIWDKSLNLIKIYDDSKTFIVNKDIEDVTKEIRAILRNDNPYSEIRKLPSLLDRYISLYGNLLSEIEKPVQAAIEEARTRTLEELKGKLCYDRLSAKVIDKFAEIKEKAVKCNNVATLQNIKVEADALKVRLLNEILDTETKMIAEQQPEHKPEDIGETKVAPNPKTQKTVSIKNINLENTWRIETAEDVDRYVERLRSELKKAVNEETILNVEF